MDALLLQDWTTLRGAASVATLTQAEPDWLDLVAYQDVVAWLEIKEFTPTATNIPTLAYQTSPSKDDALFFNMAPPVVAALGVTTTIMLKCAAPAGCPPCGRWFRWQIAVTGGVAWDLTFRIWIAANRIGNRVAISPAVTLAELEGEGNRYAYGQYPTTSTSQGTTPQPPNYGGNQGGPGGGGVPSTGFHWGGVGNGNAPGVGTGSSGGTLYNTSTGDSGHDPHSGVHAK